MRALTKQERAAVVAVAGHVSATWEAGDGEGPAAWLTVDGARIAVEVAVIGGGESGGRTKPQLRFDRVVLRLLDGLKSGLAGEVPDRAAVILTVTAPILLPGKTGAAIEGRVRDRLARGAGPGGIEETIQGNGVRIRFLDGLAGQMPKLVGFVHNPETDPGMLLDLTEALLRRVGTAAQRPLPPGFAGGRWLVVADEEALPVVGLYRDVCAQLSASTLFEKILIVLARGRVETLAG
jgi:hypothetical protein